MSYEELADVMGVPIGTVRSRIFRGRRALQERLAAFHVTPPRAAAGRKA
jgi:RNA polymerase sigma-70 factor (ECF subfamily)